ncbi:MAG: D-alanine--D-alanine ligase [Alistipes sp.]|nr:D-alanine--D-alanine ligase [Alistipes sp.]
MKINVGVIFGGRSVENEISVITAAQTMAAMNVEKYNIVPIYISKEGHWYTGDKLRSTDNYRDMKSLLSSVEEVYLRPVYGDNRLYKVRKPLFGSDVVTTLDVILPALHGTSGEDGSFQGLIEMTGIPYACPNTLASANGMDKITMKMILRESGIPVVDYAWFSDKEWLSERDDVLVRCEALNYPLIVKPANLGSSVGIKAVHNREELVEAVDNAIRYSKRIIVEVLVERLKEINCSVLGDYYDCKASVCEAPVRSGEILSYEDKYLGGGKNKPSEGMHSTVREIPARLSDEVTEYIRTTACKTFRVLACDGVSRIDFMIDEATNNIYVNEINTIPGSLSFYLWEATGVPFDELVDTLIGVAFKRKRDSEFKTTSYSENIFAYQAAHGAKLGGAKGSKSR